MLEKDYAFFKLHLDEFLKSHNGEFVVIKNEMTVGFYPSQLEAFTAMKEFPLGSFLIQQIVPSEQSVIEFYTRRVQFA